MCGVAFGALVKLKNLSGQVLLFPLRGLLLRAGSRLYKYCWATAPYYYFYSLFFISALFFCLLAVLAFIFGDATCNYRYL
jgi:hypothetical protein